MSSSGSVNGSGGVPPTPYTDGGPDDQKTGHKNGRDVKVTQTTPLLREQPQTEPGGQKTKVPLGQRSVSPATGQPVLKPLPKPKDQYQSFDTSRQGTGNPNSQVTNNSTNDPVIDENTGQPVPRPGSTPPSPSSTPVNPKLTVQTTGVPPLTQKQAENKQKFIETFTMAAGFIKAHKNTFAMVVGGLMITGAVPLAIFAPPAFAVLFAIGFTVFFAGFGNAMFGADQGGGGGPQPTPPDENKPKDDDKNEPSKSPDPSQQPGQGGNPGAGGHFVMTSDPVSATSKARLEPLSKQAELDLKARQQQQANQQYLVNNLNKLLEEATVSTEGATSATITPNKRSALERGFINAISDYLARENIDCTSEMANNIVESASLLAKTSEGTAQMSPEERQAAFQKAFIQLIRQSGIPQKSLSGLKVGLDEFFEQNKGKLSQAAKELMENFGALIDAASENEKATPVVPSMPFGGSDSVTGAPSSTRKKLTVQEVKEALKVDPQKLKDDMFNGHLLLLLDDALTVEEAQMKSTEKMKEEDIEAFRNNILSKAISVLEEKSMDGAAFRTELLSRFNSSSESDDHRRTQKLLSRQSWFRDKKN